MVCYEESVTNGKVVHVVFLGLRYQPLLYFTIVIWNPSISNIHHNSYAEDNEGCVTLHFDEIYTILVYESPIIMIHIYYYGVVIWSPMLRIVSYVLFYIMML